MSSETVKSGPLNSPVGSAAQRQISIQRAPSLQRSTSIRAQVSAPSTAVELERNRRFMDLYSRQIGAFGLEAMLKLTSLRVLLIGMRGVGIEVAKNIILAGVHTVVIYDPEPIQIRDLGSNFFLTEADVGKPRVLACIAKLAELNSHVRVEPHFDPLSEDFVAAFDVVIFTKGDQPTFIKWNEFCRTHTRPHLDEHGYVSSRPAPIPFISCFTAGVAGSVFSDFGPTFVVRDKTGNEPFQKIVVGMSLQEQRNIQNGTEVATPYTLVHYITPVGQTPGSIPDGTLISFSEIEGMFSKTEAARSQYGLSVNTSGSWRCWHPEGDPINTVRIGDTSIFSAYINGGLMTEVKEPVTKSFRSLTDCILYPSKSPNGVIGTDESDYGFVMMDMMSSFSPGGMEQQVHIALQSLHMFEQKHKRAPSPNSAEDASECVSLAHQFNATARTINTLTPRSVQAAISVDQLDEGVVRRIALMSTVDSQPLCAFFGGVIAQEVVKISGKFTPLNQWLVYEDLGALPEAVPTDTAPLGCRYDDQIALYGRAFQERLGDLRMFMVGCGALGCEYVKNFALTGICCGPNGMLTITDNDRIEVSNLNRQFLFRQENVGKPKSLTAANRAKFMNDALKVTALEDLLAPSTEHVFDDDFWLGLDVVCNALDNFEARLYSDSKCVLFQKPLLESATMGTGANVDIVLPGITRSYGEGGLTSEQGGIPMCTLRNFPHLIEHCIEWSRAMFADLFVDPAQEASRFLESPSEFLLKVRSSTLDMPCGSDRTGAVSKAVPKMRMLLHTLESSTRSPTINDCVIMAFEAFHTLFRDRIQDLTTRFPEDYKTESGQPFWAGHKKFPSALKFNYKDPTHLDFVISAANIFASVLRIHGPKPPSQENDASHRWMAEYRDHKWVLSVLAALPTPAYVAGSVSNLDDNAGAGSAFDTKSTEQEEKELATLLDKLAAIAGDCQRGLEPADFEKDDDDNFHIDFITAAANLRASNYHIPIAPRHKCKMIAGRIIPAVATTTAAVTGLVLLELYKHLLSKPIEKFRNGFFNLGSNNFTRFEPTLARKVSTASTTVMDYDGYKRELLDHAGQLEEAQLKLSGLKKLLAELKCITSDAAALAHVETAISQAEQALAYVVESEPKEEEFKEVKQVVAYPNPHTIWDQILVPSSVASLPALIEYLKTVHHLTLSRWSMEVKKMGLTLYPITKPVDGKLLPPFSASLADAFRAIRANKSIASQQQQQYIEKWKELVNKGEAAYRDFVTTVAPVPIEEQLSLRDFISQRTGMDMSKRRRLYLNGVLLVDERGHDVETAKLILQFD